MDHSIEHAVGIYIGLLVVACLVGIAAKYIGHLPYTIFLTLTGLLVGIFHIGPSIAETGFSHDLIFFVFLPPLLFQGAFHMELNRLIKHIAPIACFAIPGVIVSTVLVGGVIWWLAGISSLLIAMLFGALISPTDPISVLAMFRQTDAPEDLRVLVEGESLFNDATGVVIFTILLDAVLNTQSGGLNIGIAIFEFVKVSGGGLLLGGVLGYIAFYIMRRMDDPLLENAICLTLAFGAFWLAEVLHLSGVIATVMAGLFIGNHGRRLAMDKKTSNTIETFFESIDFILNSFLFILIGLELREIPDFNTLAVNPWRLLLVAIIAMLAGRAFVVYTFYWALNRVGHKRPKSFKHILFWGGLRGSIPIALLLHLPAEGVLADYRPALLVAGFGCVFFSLVIQGITMKPLMKHLKIGAHSS